MTADDEPHDGFDDGTTEEHLDEPPGEPTEHDPDAGQIERPDRRPALIAAGVWAALWTTLTVTGQGFTLRTLYAGYQFLPAAEAYDDPFGAVWNLHIQPPLWNFWVAAIGAWSPLSLTTSHRLVALGLGVVLAWAICETLLLLGAPRGVAIGLTLVATLNTQVLQHAFEPRYDFAVAALLALLVWSLARLRLGGPVRWPVALPIVVATVVASIRALYHPVWLLGLIVLVLWAIRGRAVRREAVAACLFAVVAVGGWMVKNQVEFDRFTMSTWTGMNLLRSTSPAVDDERLVELTERGEISSIWRDGLAAYALALPCEPVEGDHPVLARTTRDFPAEHQTGALDDDFVPNFNSRCFLPAYDQAAADFRYLLVHEPGAWVRGRVWATNNWFEVPTTTVYDPSPLWRPLDRVTRVVLLGVPHPGLPSGWSDAAFWVHASPQSLLVMAATIAVLARAVVAVRRRVGRDEVVYAVIGWITVFTVLAGIGFELGEQGRFRNAIDPVVIAVGSWLLYEAWARRRARWGA